jgi:hypothetical protein
MVNAIQLAAAFRSTIVPSFAVSNTTSKTRNVTKENVTT